MAMISDQERQAEAKRQREKFKSDEEFWRRHNATERENKERQARDMRPPSRQKKPKTRNSDWHYFSWPAFFVGAIPIFIVFMWLIPSSDAIGANIAIGSRVVVAALIASFVGLLNGFFWKWLIGLAITGCIIYLLSKNQQSKQAIDCDTRMPPDQFGI